MKLSLGCGQAGFMLTLHFGFLRQVRVGERCAYPDLPFSRPHQPRVTNHEKMGVGERCAYPDLRLQEVSASSGKECTHRGAGW